MKIKQYFRKYLIFLKKKVTLPSIMKEKIIKLNDIKKINLQAVLDLLLQTEGLSRIELAKKIGCDNTTISRAVRQLIERGIIVQGEKAAQGHGRPRIALRINPDGPLLMGISLEAERITGVLTDLRGNVKIRDQVIFAEKTSKNTFLDTIKAVIGRLKKNAGSQLMGIGAAVFGSYAGPEITISNAAAMPDLNGMAMRPFFSETAGTDVVICDHLVSEMSFLVSVRPKLNTGMVMLVSLGSGIGSLIAENGRLLFARNNHASELGHSIYVPDGIPCSCGRKGCLETVASLRVLRELCRQKLNNPDLSYDELCMILQGGRDGGVLDSELDRVARFLGLAISNQINNYPADSLVITGRMLKLGIRFQSILKKRITENLFASIAAELRMEFIPTDFDNSLARGAAVFAGKTAFKSFESV